MTTWENVFTGYDMYADVFNSNSGSTLYTDASNSDGFFQLFDSAIVKLPYDFIIVFKIFYTVLPLTILIIMFFVFFVPLINKVRQW